MSDTSSDQLTVPDDLYNQLAIPVDEMASPVLPNFELLSSAQAHATSCFPVAHVESVGGGRLQPPSADCPTQHRQIRTVNQFDFFDSSPLSAED